MNHSFPKQREKGDRSSRYGLLSGNGHLGPAAVRYSTLWALLGSNTILASIHPSIDYIAAYHHAYIFPDLAAELHKMRQNTHTPGAAPPRRETPPATTWTAAERVLTPRVGRTAPPPAPGGEGLLQNHQGGHSSRL